MENYVGCSGFYYKHWIDKFYPEDLPKSKWLGYYAEHFNTVELNNSFYRMPDEKAVKNWYTITPASFIFSVKGLRFITHLKKLTVDEMMIDYLTRFQNVISLLKDKLGPVLWQLPGNFNLNLTKLDKFCELLNTDFYHVFEFRNKEWFTQEVYDLLEKYKYGLCIVSGPEKVPEIVKSTSETGYVRFHGKAMYSSNYSNEDLKEWKMKLEKLPAKRLFAYFNNDANAYAVSNAQYLTSLFALE